MPIKVTTKDGKEVVLPEGFRRWLAREYGFSYRLQMWLIRNRWDEKTVNHLIAKYLHEKSLQYAQKSQPKLRKK